MEILPINLITQEDAEIFGAELLSLAKLSRLDFPVAKGYGVTSPDIQLNTVLEHFDFKNREVFEQSLSLVKKEVEGIAENEEFKKVFRKEKWFYLNGVLVKGYRNLWLALLNNWLAQIRERIWREGFSPKLTQNLLPKKVFLINRVEVEIKSFVDPDKGDVVIESLKRLEPKILRNVDELTALANKGLFLPQVYKFVLAKGKVELVEVTPFTQVLPGSIEKQVVMSKAEQKKAVRSAVKVFLNLTLGFATLKNIDGILIESDYQFDLDSLVFKLAEAAISFPQKEVILKLPDDEGADVRGCLRLVHQPKVLDRLTETVLFLRNKKQLYNIRIGIPLVRSAGEYLQLKRELAVRGMLRKGGFGFWLEMSVPENFINMEEYLVAGFDGAVINLDTLWEGLGGVRGEELVFYKHEIGTLAKFLKEPLKKLHKEKVPVLVMGKLVLHPEILDFLVEEGIFGIVANNRVEAEGLPEHLSFTEKRLIHKKVYSI